MIRILTATFIITFLCFGCKKPTVKDLYVKTDIDSKVLKESRNLFIQLPSGYYDQKVTHDQYPVLVLLDGNSYLDHTINTIETLNKEEGQASYSPIIVAIDSPDREKDFTFTKIETVRKNNTGNGKIFLKFIEDELIPFIDDHYKTSDSRMLIGHSLGGLCVVNIFLSDNDTFRDYIASDPSIWWEPKAIEEKLQTSASDYQGKNIYIATAFRDSINQSKNLEKHQLIARVISDKSGMERSRIQRYYPNESHRSIPRVAIRDGIDILNQ
ncbi:MAG: alpha/beta hydrolase [Saprospiraceae bacterium]|nr:alpha/beta hydrolase [Saprospiraceae bacterium]